MFTILSLLLFLHGRSNCYPYPPAPATKARSYAGPMGLLFLLFGAVTNFKDVLMPYPKAVR